MKFAVVVYLALFGITARGNAAAVVTTNNLFTAPQCVHSTGPSNIEDMGCSGRTTLVTLHSDKTLADTDCGSVFSTDSVATYKVTLPAAPFFNCEFTFEPGTVGFYVDFNTQFALLPGYEGNVTKWTIPQVPAFRTDRAAISLQFNGTNWEQSAFSSPIFQTAAQPTNASQFANGQVYFSWNSSTSQFQLCPRNGPGGIIVDGAIREIPQECLTLSKFPVTSSSVNYFYATRTVGDTLSVTSVVVDPSGKVLIGFSNTLLGDVNDLVGNCLPFDWGSGRRQRS